MECICEELLPTRTDSQVDSLNACLHRTRAVKCGKTGSSDKYFECCKARLYRKNFGKVAQWNVKTRLV